ncbi:MAG TPA: elongation factor P [Candidatus Saccharimonadales bacterium]|nr:elongation factor P [Candidatus Saccharimonadales bacterium]
MSLSITDLKKGTIFQLNDTPYKVIEYSQKVLGRGGSIVNVKIKSLFDGKVLEKTFKGNDSIKSADIQNAPAQFLYADDKNLFFMNSESYETFEVPKHLLGEQEKYLKESQQVTAQYFNGNVINVELPKNVFLQVEYAEEAVRGDTSSAVTKDARLETGVSVRVPAFIKTGDIISVDTTTGNYRERKKA